MYLLALHFLIHFASNNIYLPTTSRPEMEDSHYLAEENGRIKRQKIKTENGYDLDPVGQTAAVKSEGGKSSKIKPEQPDMNPMSNPYLAHMYDGPTNNEYSEGYYSKPSSKASGPSKGGGFGKIPRHATTAAMAQKAEDGPDNPFSGQPLSNQYFNILKTRRDLPVHSQR